MWFSWRSRLVALVITSMAALVSHAVNEGCSEDDNGERQVDRVGLMLRMLSVP